MMQLSTSFRFTRQRFTLIWVLLFWGPSLLSLSAQSTFNATYGSDSLIIPVAAQELSNGQLMLAGHYSKTTTPPYSSFLSVLQSNGNVSWTNDYSLNGNLVFADGMEISDGFMMTGSYFSSDFSTEQGMLLKLNSSGDVVWSKAYGGSGEHFEGFIQTADQGFLMFGATNGFSSGASNDLYLVKTDSSGSLAWTKVIGITGQNDWTSDIIELSQGGFMVLGTGHSGLGNHDLLLCRLNESGDTVWTKSYGTAEFDFAQNIRQTSDLEFLIAGDGYDSNGNQEIILLKTDSAGIVLWSRSYGTSGDEEVKDVLLTANGELILCGILDGGSNDVNSFAMKVDQNGDTVWVKSYGDISHDELRGMNMASNGDLLLFGATNSFGASFFTSQLMRLSSDGSGAGCYEGGATMSLDTVQMMSRRGLAVGSGGAEFTLSVNDSSISFPYNLLCTTVGVQTSLPEAQLLAYPNPTSGHIRIIGKPGSKGRLVDLNGRLHMEVDMVDRETEFNISHLPSGVYFLLTENSSLKITRL